MEETLLGGDKYAMKHVRQFVYVVVTVFQLNYRFKLFDLD